MTERQRKIKDAMEGLYERHGQLTPMLVVEEAKAEDHPLHDEFEWDVERAAKAHWLDRARQLIREVEYKVTYHNTTISCPVYTRDPSKEPREQGYTNLSNLRSNRELALAALEQEKVRILSAIDRMQRLEIGIESQQVISSTAQQMREKLDALSQRLVASPNKE